MRLYDLFGDGKPQTGSSRGCGTSRIQSEELLEYALQLVGRNGFPMVLYSDESAWGRQVCMLHKKANGRIRIAVVYGVPDEVIEDPFQLVAVARDFRIRFQLSVDHQIFLRQDRAEFVGDLLQHPCKVGPFQLQRYGGEIEAGDFKEFIYQIFQALGFFQGDAQIFAAGGI